MTVMGLSEEMARVMYFSPALMKPLFGLQAMEIGYSTLRPEHSRQNVVKDILKCVFLNENDCILISN